MNSVARCLICGEDEQFDNSGRNVQLFRFPKDVDRCRAWVKAIGRHYLVFMPIDKLRQQVLCADHFDPQCINKKFKRLHKVAIPKSPFLPLSDVLMNNFPRQYAGPAPAMHNLRATEQPSTKPIILNGQPYIDFGRPLRNNLETLHNETHAVAKPATWYTTISVPQMSYPNSLESGNVFAVEYPGNVLKLPLPIIEPVNHDDHVAAKKPRMATNKVATDLIYPNSSPGSIEPNNEWLKDTARPNHTNTLVDSRKPISIISDIRGTSTTNKMYKKPLGAVKPTLKAVNKPKFSGTNVSFGLNTVITGSSRRTLNSNRNSNVNAFGGTLNPSTGTTESRYQGIRQYTNNKLTIHKNIPLVPMKPATAAPVIPATAVPFIPATAAPVIPATAAPVMIATAAPVMIATAAPVIPGTAAVPLNRATAMPQLFDFRTTANINQNNTKKQYTELFSPNTVFITSGLVTSTDGTLMQIFEPMRSAATEQQNLGVAFMPNTTSVQSHEAAIQVFEPMRSAATEQQNMGVTFMPNTTPVQSHEATVQIFEPMRSAATEQQNMGVTFMPNTTPVQSHEATVQIFEPMRSAATEQQDLDVSFVPNTTSVQRHDATVQIFEPMRSAATEQQDLDVFFVPNTTSAQSHEATANSSDAITLESQATISSNASLGSPGPTENELVFVPYTQYEGTISPDSINAHTAEGTDEYGLPLMNCVGTIFQGNIHYTDKTEGEPETIDVPLMCYLKSLENSNIS